MQPDEAFRAAEAKIADLPEPTHSADLELDRLRGDCIRFFAALPEPPVYSRKDDPVREKARELIPAGEALLARCLKLTRDGVTAEPLGPLTQAVKGHLAALCHIAAGKLGPAEKEWAAAAQAERDALSVRRLFTRTDEERPRVYDREKGSSRYDPAPEATIRVKLACPTNACHHTDDFAFSPRHSTHQFTCPSCKNPFIAYFGEVRFAQVQDDPHAKVRRYLFRLEELSGGLSRIEFEDASLGDFVAGRQDLIAFIYSADRQLQGVLNLSTSRLLWVKRAGACFIATVAFGEGAPELAAFRAFRDDVLRRTEAGAWLVRGYYRAGPGAAAYLARHPVALRFARAGLGALHRVLARGSRA